MITGKTEGLYTVTYVHSLLEGATEATTDEELATGRAWMAEQFDLTPAFFSDRWGPLPHKSPLMLSLLCDSAAHDGLIHFRRSPW